MRCLGCNFVAQSTRDQNDNLHTQQLFTPLDIVKHDVHGRGLVMTGTRSPSILPCGEPAAGRREGNGPTRPAQSNRTIAHPGGLEGGLGNSQGFKDQGGLHRVGRDGGNQGSSSAVRGLLEAKSVRSLAAARYQATRASALAVSFPLRRKTIRKTARGPLQGGRAHAVRTAAKQQAVSFHSTLGPKHGSRCVAKGRTSEK